MSERLDALVCRRYVPGARYVRGSTAGEQCDLCGMAVVMALSSWRYLATHPWLPVWCVPCATARAAEEEAG